jgi:PAS domain S-box-containing protein
MNAQSIPVVAMAGISLYVGLYHLLIYSRRRQHREDLTFALLCLATCLYNVFCVGLYNSSTVAEGVQWQRAQLIALALFTTAFLWFAADYMQQRPGPVVYAFTAFYLVAIFIQLVDRSSLTWVSDPPSIKEIVLSADFKIVYYEAVFGPFTTVQSLMGLVASTYILVNGIRFYQRGYKREARPLLVAMGLMYVAALNDTAVANGLYQFAYTIEYGYMAIILLMAYSLSNTIVEAAMAKEALRTSEERFRALVETTSDWVWEVDRSGVYTYTSPKVVELLGYEPQDIIGKTPFDLMPPAEAKRINAIFLEMMNALKPIEGLENIVRRKDGQNVILETSGVPFFDSRGKLLGYRGIDRDITERRRAEEALRESEEKFRSIFEQSSDSIVLCNEEGRIVAWNHAAEQMTGLTRTEAAGHDYWDIQFRLLPEAQATPEAYERIRSMMEEALRTGQAHWLNQLLEGEMRGPAGQRLYFQQVASPIRTSKGFMISSITRDITEHRRSDEALRASEALYQSLVEILPMSVCRKDLEGRFTFVNQRYCNEFKRPASDILGKTDFDLHPADLAEKYRQDDRAVMTSGQTVEMIEEHAPLYGERTYVQVFKSPVYDARGQVTGIQIAFWDVTERKRAEETLQMFQYTIDRSSDAVQWLNREGGFEYVNDQACRSLGYTREELMSLRLWDIDPIYPRERWDANWESYQPGRRGGSEIVETLHRRKDGSVFPVEVLSNHLWFGDRELHVAVVRDITERKRAEAERERLITELENKNAELERFTYTASHDLKSPLVTIRGFLGFLEKDALAGDLDQLRADVTRVQNAADRMQRLLNELLELSRIGRLMNEPETVAFAAIVQEAIQLAQGRITENGVQVEIQPDLPVVHGDRTRLVEVVQNLVDNACKFMGDQAEPRITIGRRGSDREGRPILFVRDNGSGIDPEYQEKIFGLFNKLDPRSEGTGIGLTIVRRIVEVHGGRIWVESAGAKTGSTFYFTLPVE